MFILRPLKNRSIALLWSGQLLSAVGDEVYRVALIWLAVSLIGERAGYIAAVQSGAVLVCGLVVGRWADRWNSFRTMIVADTLRMLLVLLPPILSWLWHLPIWVLIVVAFLVSGLSTLFDPALQSSLPEMTTDPETLQATNGLLDGTRRLARIFGPAIVGILGSRISTLQFFNLDSLSFLISAVSILMIGGRHSAHLPAEEDREPTSIAKSFKKSLDLVRSNKVVFHAFICASIGWPMWFLAMALALPLWLKADLSSRVEAFGYVLTAYGVGNVISNIFWAGYRTKFPERIMFSGLAIVGLGIFFLPAFLFLPWMMFMSAFAAFGGPMDDLFLLKIFQSNFRSKEIGKIFRLLMASSQGMTLIVFLASPWILHGISPRFLISICGGVMMLSGLSGLLRFRGRVL